MVTPEPGTVKAAAVLSRAAHRLEAPWTLGMRPGELTGLRWEDVDFDTGVISVLQSLKHSRGTARTSPGPAWPPR